MLIVPAQFERFAIERHHVNVSIQNRLAITQADQVFTKARFKVSPSFRLGM